MSATTLTVWTCDRCGARDETDPAKQPTGWKSVIIVDPPKASVQEPEYTDRKHLCRRCAESVRMFILTPDPVMTERAS